MLLGNEQRAKKRYLIYIYIKERFYTKKETTYSSKTLLKVGLKIE